MICRSCRHENRDEAQFCEECAAPLSRTCDRCGATLRPTAKFCDTCAAPLVGGGTPTREPRAYTPEHLAEKILTSRSALEGERKQVTVLFADVKGSMELAERVDPEEWHKILDRFFAILAEGVHRFEGTVNQYTGDGVMALFGAPIAHEDHAQRACWAALHLEDELRRFAEEVKRTRGLSFAVRMGLNSGEVVVGKIGDDLRMDYTAQGHTVGLAHRMEQLADPGRTYLTAHTAALVAGYFRLRDLGAFDVKGVREPVRVHELEGTGALRTRLDASRVRGFSRFVGRADELAVLEAALARAAEGEAQVIGVVAEPGVGKSRLCHEFVQRCRARGFRVDECHGLPHGRSVPLLPWMEALRSYFGISERDGDEEARDKIAGRIVRLAPELESDLPIVFDFLGVPDPARAVPPIDPEARQSRLTAITGQLARARSARGETIVHFYEDLHWFDPASDAMLAALVEGWPGTRTLGLFTFRPEYRAPWMEGPLYRAVPLQPLGSAAVSELLQDLLGSDPSLAGLGERIAPRAAGNPFFVEEVVQALVEAGHLAGAKGAYRLARAVDDLAIPPTVQALLAARVDRLPEGEKGVLQTAAVIGKEFTGPVLRLVTGLPDETLAAVLDALARAEFLHETALYPEAEYAFKHPLTQEVAYRSLLGERRRQIHDAVAHAIERTYPEKLDERAALVAHHWECAGDRLAAARWHHQAGRWLRTRDIPEAIRHWRRARELLREVPESEDAPRLGLAVCRNLLGHAWIVGMPDDEVMALLEEGNALATRRKDFRSLALLRWGYGEHRRTRGWIAEFSELLREVLRLSEEVGDSALTYAVRATAVMTNAMRGDLHEARRDAAQLLDLPTPD